MNNTSNDNTNNILAAIFILLQVVFIGLFVASIGNLFVNDEIFGGEIVRSAMTPIKNLTDVVPDLPDNQVDNIEQTLFGVILNNTQGTSLSQNSAAKIVEDTVNIQYFDPYDVYLLGATIDIPEIQQSYEFLFQYSNNPDNPYLQSAEQAYIIICPQAAYLQLYPGFNCKDIFDVTSQRAFAAEILSYFDFSVFSAESQPDDLSEIVISPALPNVSDSEREVYVTTTKEAITSIGVSPDLFTYHVSSLADIGDRLTED